jgi:release factor glutamine methyltransferase
MTTVDEALAEAASKLAAAGIAEPRLEARVLVTAALGLSREALLAHGDKAVPSIEAVRLSDYVARRAAGEPTARILGHKEFWSLDFEVTADTLIPRPETETLIEAALASFSDRRAPLAVLDLGTGTSCLLLALLSELPQAQGVGVDINPAAVAVARRNAERLGLANRATIVEGDFAGELAAIVGDRRFDIILSNPPYIRDGDIAGLAPEVARFEPRLALSGGADGLAAYRALARGLSGLLAPGGRAFLEIGQGQAEAVGKLMADADLAILACRADLAGIVRCLAVGPATSQKNPLTSRN